MKLIHLIIILTLANICIGQDIELVTTETDTFYKVLKDSININHDYPDGRYKVFVADTNRLPKHVFYLRNGNVDGPYLELTHGEWTYGTYFQDSLWTFLTAPEDTVYKIGTWRHFIYPVDHSVQDIYKIPYNKNGEFIEVWYFHNGQKAREAFFKKGFGLEKETYWDFETNRISKQVINSGSENYYQSITYVNDSISYVSIKQNGIEINMNFDYPICQNKPCVDIQVYTDNWEMPDLPMTTLTIDSSMNLTGFRDVKRQIFVQENKDGNISIEYVKTNGKRKCKTFKIK